MDTRTISPEQYLEIDNPGQGDCAFYAFGVGWINIYHQLKSKKQSDADRLFDTLFENISAEERLDYEKEINQFNFHNPNLIFMSFLNTLLRQRLYEFQIQSLNQVYVDTEEYYQEDNDYTLKKKIHFVLEDNQLFIDAMAVFYHYYNKKTNPHYDVKNDVYAWKNDLFLDHAIRNEMIQLAGEIVFQERANGNMSDIEKQKLVRIVLFTDKKAYCQNAVPLFSEHSLIAKSLVEKKKSGRWGSYEDLKILAEFFDISLVAHIRGMIHYSPDYANKPTLILNQPSAFHWTTFIDPFHGFKADEKILPFKRFFHQPELSKKEIGNVMHEYLPENLFWPTMFYTRHHQGIARRIEAACNNPAKSLEDVMSMIEITYPLNCKPDGEYALSVHYILARYGKGLPVLNLEMKSDDIELQSFVAGK